VSYHISSSVPIFRGFRDWTLPGGKSKTVFKKATFRRLRKAIQKYLESKIRSLSEKVCIFLISAFLILSFRLS